MRVLVANRGEIARRVIATCHRLGLSAVAVCSDPDVAAPHVREADAAVRLPGSRSSDTYLRADLLVDAALRSGAGAVHPGYGFLSENASFARLVIEAGLTWIGPSPEVISVMGSKVEAKRLAEKAGVPVLAGLDPVTESDLPVLIKASAGGGGRGMRVVRVLSDLAESVSAAQAEAAAAFGDPTVFIEPLIEHAHHIEVQVMGTAVLGERECSVQRRHQKVIEESPSPLVSRIPGMRSALYSAAEALARAVGYTGAGTIEFLAAPDGRFWFLEMNTRLQVEHPVTEATTGLDLVELQIRAADGAAAAATPTPRGTARDGAAAAATPTPRGTARDGAAAAATPTPRGTAIEARLYAEEPAAGWAPSTGPLHLFDVPATHPPFTPPGGALRGVRVDSGVEDGTVIGAHYDPMLAKVIAWAPTRDEATALLSRALVGARIHGPRTNRDLLVRVLQSPEFAAGTADTGLLESPAPTEPARASVTHQCPSKGVGDSQTPFTGTAEGAGGTAGSAGGGLFAPLVGAEEEHVAAVAAALAGAARRHADAPVFGELPSGWRNVPTQPQRTVLASPHGEHVVDYRVTRDGTTADGVRVVSVTPETVVMEVEGVMRRWRVARYRGAEHGEDRWDVDGDAGSVTFTEVPRFPETRLEAAEGSLLAPLPGTVVEVRAAVGDEVDADQPLIVLEAMKMQHVVRADRAGRVKALFVQTGSTVEVGAVLAEVQP
jgi:propionyl-CoA carboxylase alpha chain